VNVNVSKPHILVVDDEPNVLVTYRLILQQQGYEVSAAISSEEARNTLQRGVDLLLCDLSLEKQQSGFDVIHFGRTLDPKLQAVLLTGYASVEANERAEQENIPVLFKPIDIQQLLQMIADLLRKNDESREAHGH
jgi:DNA-binding NtrC family response regulator